jgi:hypothetical protein
MEVREMKKYLPVIIIAVIAIAALVGIYSQTESQPSNETTLTVYMGLSNVSTLADDIRTNSIFSGYDNETLTWLESLNPSYTVLFNNESYVVMSESDASKIPMEFVTDVSITYTFKCNVLEKRSLGNNLNDILYVDNVEYLTQNITYYDA